MTGTPLENVTGEIAALVSRLPGPVRRVVLRSAGHEVEIEWQPPSEPPAAERQAERQADRPAQETAAAESADASLVVVRAPLVGTFYRAPQPGADPFVEVGDVVEEGQTVAIVEAMKLMNDIVAEVSGRVVEICVGNAEPVEFDQPLLRIAPLAA